MQIMGDLLNATELSGIEGIKVTTLLRKGNISYTRFSKFINNMTGSGLINKIEFDGRNTFVITDRGRLYLAKYKQFQSLTDSFGLEI